MILNNKKILLGVSGSIAAYKIAFLTRLLVKEGAEVKIVMTQAAKEFITPHAGNTFEKSRCFRICQRLNGCMEQSRGFGFVGRRNADCSCYSTYFIEMCQWYL
jgi:phosphopantothenoylcysteine synthetase/decarboxylase